MKKGKFIVFEGIDGCGKGTQIELLKNKLNDNKKYYFTREPSDGPIGKILREEYLSGNRTADFRTLDNLFMADRLDHITNDKNGILKLINNGITVISDRYYLSSYAYNTYECVRELYYSYMLIREIKHSKPITSLLKPDVTIFLDIPYEESIKRIIDNRSEISIYENEERLSKISEAYHKAIRFLKDVDKEDIRIINANRDENIISNDIWDNLKGIL